MHIPLMLRNMDELTFGSITDIFSVLRSIKGCKCYDNKLNDYAYTAVGSINYINTLYGQPISILVLRHFH